MALRTLQRPHNYGTQNLAPSSTLLPFLLGGIALSSLQGSGISLVLRDDVSIDQWYSEMPKPRDQGCGQ